MSPSDKKAVRLCAQLMGVPEDGYDPIGSSRLAKELRDKLGLKVEHKRRQSQTEIIVYAADGKRICGYIGSSENIAIVRAAVENAHGRRWYEKK